MGTRGLTIVKLGGQVKVAQYGQWDHYPTGQGEVISKFLREELDLRKFKAKVRALEFVLDKEVEQKYEDLVKAATKFKIDVNAEFKYLYPQFHRDTGATILSLVQAGEATQLQNSMDFLSDGLFCEYAYELDLDDKTIKVYVGGEPYKTYKFSEFAKVGAMKKLEEELRG